MCLPVHCLQPDTRGTTPGTIGTIGPRTARSVVPITALAEATERGPSRRKIPNSVSLVGYNGRWYWMDLLICTSTSFGTENFKNLVLTFLYSARVPGTALIGRSRTYNVQEGEALAREDSRET